MEKQGKTDWGAQETLDQELAKRIYFLKTSLLASRAEIRDTMQPHPAPINTYPIQPHYLNLIFILKGTYSGFKKTNQPHDLSKLEQCRCHPDLQQGHSRRLCVLQLLLPVL